jgi:hypothetical protein
MDIGVWWTLAYKTQTQVTILVVKEVQCVSWLDYKIPIRRQHYKNGKTSVMIIESKGQNYSGIASLVLG